MRKYTWTTFFGFSLSFIGLLLIIFFSFSRSFNDGSGQLDAELANNFGGFIGGLVGPIFSLAGFFLLYETIAAQRKSFEIQQFEANFFELIHIHRDNVSQMVHKVPWDDNNYYDKARVFIEIKSQFSKIFKTVKTYVDDSSQIIQVEKEKSSIIISYLILFFGVSKATRPDLSNSLEKLGYDKTLTNKIINEIYSKKTKYNNKTVYFGGHQVRLGHYFRHLFQTIKFVDKSKFLNDTQKYEYVKTLRSQLTQHELAIFFLNSLSIGHEWNENGYITKYKLVKNLPKNFIADNINPKDYYGNFKYEWENYAAADMGSPAKRATR